MKSAEVNQSWFGAKSEKQNLILFKNRASEIAGCERAGIQIYSIVMYLWLAYRCVAVDHNLSEAPPIV
jgi:hypothetical protein